ncbi:exodeoxyribonuclease VII large subunit [Deinococcus maricopensis]|uniref:Exodeoxyribonuclease 7 large subunit n=1 Tax=Deinococcus maricopensis (strain DSM 21211 / LMG 22137 / NRRL B-23946 / LB-34) TaxID=709986 RepID=E8UC81_DEIML|nr:exodeoxyribonuclease VII large subunit [Deinococcus maricopensis]ADV68742.1 Exodeoxyribonuclease VII [Deinococcus maricopensis DSM 21211]
MSRKRRAEDRAPTQFLELSELLGYVAQVLHQGVPGGVWVRAEIAQLTDRRHLYLDLVQADEDGRELAKARGTVWARERFALEGKFRRATGAGLTAGLRVLLMVTVEFHEQYGFSLNVVDVAPEFTVGDMAQQLARLRVALEAEGLYGLNRALPLPEDFTRVLVLSPAGAAGLGDFTREADRLSRAGVVNFTYLSATFQGREASASLTAALAEARRLHAEEAFDALVIIRGGGASTDLAWLNDLAVARAVAAFPAPVVTGLGHARDDTILDEVARVRCDTPSKAAQFITRVVVEAAGAAEAAYAQVRGAARAAVHEAKLSVSALRVRVLGAARARVEADAAGADAHMRAVLGLTPERTLARGYALVRDAAGRVVRDAAGARAGALTLTFQDGEVRVRVDDAP